jgi:hypothetical protein
MRIGLAVSLVWDVNFIVQRELSKARSARQQSPARYSPYGPKTGFAGIVLNSRRVFIRVPDSKELVILHFEKGFC